MNPRTRPQLPFYSNATFNIAWKRWGMNAVNAAENKFKNPYGDQGRVGEIGVTSSGWGQAVDLGYTIVDPQGPHSGKIGILHIHTCIELPCTGNYKTSNLSYIAYCPIDIFP